MRYFAQLDENNLVINTSCCNDDFILYVDEYILDENNDSIPTGNKIRTIPENHTILEYSIDNDSFTNNFASIGSTYDSDLNAFILPQPDPTYILNTQTYEWEPDENLEYDLHGDGKLYRYNKELNGWTPTWDPEES